MVNNEAPRDPQTTTDEVPDQPETIATPDTNVRSPGQGPGDPTRFNRNPEAPDRETQRASPVPALASGMFLPVILLIIVAVVVIVWIAM